MEIAIDGYTSEAIGYHLWLLGNAELLDVEETTSFGALSPTAIAKRMTWAGHEFVDNARNETVWRKVKSSVAAKGGSVSFEVLRSGPVCCRRCRRHPDHRGTRPAFSSRPASLPGSAHRASRRGTFRCRPAPAGVHGRES